jgi:bis(5'-nucleosidyl)-tetraphosphatase
MITCGAVIFRQNYGHVEYLILRAYSHWEFPKGRPDADDFDLIETACREIKEETSLRNLIFITDRNGKKYFCETEPYGKQNKIARFYLCNVSTNESQKVFLPISDELGRPEHEDFRWLNYESTYRLLNDRLKKVLNWADKIINSTL